MGGPTRSSLHEERFNTGAVEINFGVSPPNGPPFVILHGGSGSWRSGEGLIRLLAESWHVFAPDFRGHGKSGHVPGSYLLQDYASDISALLQHVVQEPAVLFGHSLGGEVAVMVAAQHPEAVRALIVGDAPLSIENHPIQVEAHRNMNVLWHSLAGRPSSEITPELKEMPVPGPGAAPRRAVEAFGEDNPWFEFKAENLSRLDPGVLAAVLAGPAFMLRGYEAEKLLPMISCPVLLLQADQAAGGMMRDDEVRDGLQLLPHGSHVHLHGIGHELHGPAGQERRVLEVISPFLATV
jgi:pimeloyl-ACP methyl ester carboxylesterase